MRSQIVLSAVSFVALAVSTAANAQTAESAPDRDKREGEDIVVTGTRIARDGFEAPTPVTAIETESLARKAPGAIADGLNQLPQFQNSTNTASRSTGTAGAQNTGNYLNMRALGPNRVLVLQDGQRMAPSGNNGGVDVSLIPSMLVQRTEVVTGGVSAVYGSDAVSGVVNFILDKHMTGFKALAQGGIATTGHLPSYRIGAAGGVSLMDGRLHIIASAERYYTDALHRRYFPVIAEGWGVNGLGTLASPYVAISGIRATQLSNQGIIASGPLAGQFTSTGAIIPVDLGTPTNTAGISIGGNGGYFDQQNGTTGSSQLMNQFFIRPEFDFGNDVVGFVSVGYNTSKYESNPGGGFLRSITIFNDNAYLTPAQRATLGASPSFSVGRIFTDGPMHDIVQASDSFTLNAGLSGKFTSSVSWSIGYTHSVTDFTSSQRDIGFEKFYAAVDAVFDANNNIVCRPTLDPDPAVRARFAGCVPLNLLGNGRGSQASYDYFWGTSMWATKNKMDNFQATITGKLIDLPAGPLSFALGGERRHVSLVQTSNADPRVPINRTGLRGVQATTKFRLTNNGIASGSQNVTEFFGELNIPVLKDSAIGSLELSGAARLTDYSTSGNVTSWKLGALFEPVDGVRFRVTVSRDIRAPTLFELFAAQQNVSQSFFDAKTNTQQGIQLISGGNANLKPEIANTLTIGAVITPAAIPGLSFSVDYYKIDIKGAIAQPYTALDILNLCNASSNAAGLTCQYISRPISSTDTTPANFPTSIRLVSDNLASQLVRGLDFELAYRSDLGGGRFNARLLATRMLEFNQINAPGLAVRQLVGTADNAGLPLPKLRGTLDLNYAIGGWTFGIQERYIGAFDRSHLTTAGNVYAKNRVPVVLYTDLNISYKFGAGFGDLELFGVVNNLFDRKPPLTPGVNVSPGLATPYYVNTYSLIGRYVTVGARIKL